MTKKLTDKSSKEAIEILSKYFQDESHQLVSSVSHDVKNPLGIIDLSVGLLEDRLSKALENEDEKVKKKIFKFLDNINVGLEKCEEILDNVLLLRRLDADYENKIDFSLKNLIDSHYIFSKPALKSKNINFDNQVPSDVMINLNEKSFTMVLNGALVNISDKLTSSDGSLMTATSDGNKLIFIITPKEETKGLTLHNELEEISAFREEVFHLELKRTGYTFSIKEDAGNIIAEINIA